ncbi:hypothetical protein QQ045_030550 [Rhodiola kirilowii]
MASSLEELLWEEGFKGRRSTDRPRHSTGIETMTRPLHPPRRSVSQQGVKMRTERTRSDISRYKSEDVASGGDRARQTKPRDNFVRSQRLEGGLLMRELSRGQAEESGSSDVYKRKEISVEASRGSSTSEIVEIQEEEVELNSKFKDIYSNEIYSSDSRRSSVSDRKDLEGYMDGSPKDFKLEKRRSRDYSRSLLGRTSFRNNEYGMPSDRSNKDSWNSKNFDSKRSGKGESSMSGASVPALDKVAVQAMISILCGHIKPFLHDENFRNSLRVNCFSSLNIVRIDEGYNSENKVISNLEQAIETVERAVTRGENTRDLKKASLQLSVITGLSSSDMKDAFTAEIPNFKLCACAHLYISVIYKLQKKEKLSAKHILQVFCISPFQARNILLPDLWEILFFPHLSHLKKWYTDEADALGHDPSHSRKLSYLEKVYNDILDSGTLQFASYYKDWLTEGVEAPSLPLILIPTLSVRGVKQKSSSSTSSEWTSSPAGPVSPQPMVSRRLYEAVFRGNNNKQGADENVTHKVNYSPDSRGAGSSTFEEKQTVAYSTKKVKYADQDENISSSGNKDGSSPQQEAHAQEYGSFEDEIVDFSRWNGSSGSSQDCQVTSMKENELILRSIAISVFEMQKARDSSHGQEMLIFSQIKQTAAVSFPPGEAFENSECLEKESFFANAPQDFICPLTGRLLGNPVTLETGQTFERAAITEWLQSGNKTCPVTGKTLECNSVPLTNFILKRIVHKWKLDQLKNPEFLNSQTSCRIMEDRKLEDQSAFYILEQLLTGLSEEERIKNANHLISLGALEFLLQRFEQENLEEAINVAPLLLFCMEADPGCRFQIARNINKQQLFSLLHGKPATARKYGVSLLTELICLNRRHDVKLLFSSLPTERLTDSMHILILHLHSSPPDQKPLIAILLLHFDLLLEPRKYSIHREEAVNAISAAMDSSLKDESVRTSCCRALFVLGGCASVSNIVQRGGGVRIEAGCKSSSLVEVSYGEVGVSQDKSILLDNEERAREAWLRDVAMSLLRSGRMSFVDMISKCLASKFFDLVRACLTTVAWLSFTLASLPDAGLHLTAFSALISQLKEHLENSELLEHKVLASVSLLNFSKFRECRVLLMTIADEISTPLRELAKISWTAKELYTILYREDSTLQGTS